MNFRIEQAEEVEAEAVAALIRSVWERMEHRDWFVPDDINFVNEILTSGRGFILKAIEAETGKTAGVMDILMPGAGGENLGHDAGFSADKLLKTAHIDSVAILPEYRGRHLQAFLMEDAERRLEAGYQYMMCTVHPDNCFSRDNMIRQGFRFICRKEKYGGRVRDIMMKEINRDVTIHFPA